MPIGYVLNFYLLLNVLRGARIVDDGPQVQLQVSIWVRITMGKVTRVPRVTKFLQKRITHRFDFNFFWWVIN